MPLEKEQAFYASIRNELLQHSEGKYVLIVGDERLGVFDSSEDAYKHGVELKGNVPMLIQRVEKTDRVEVIPALVLGIMNANL